MSSGRSQATAPVGSEGAPQIRKVSAGEAWRKTRKGKQGVSFYLIYLVFTFKIICYFYVLSVTTVDIVL